MTITHDAVTTLTSGLVVDQAKLNKLPAAELATLLAGVYTSGLPVVIVEDSNKFFSSRNLIDSLESGNTDWPLIAEKFSIELTSADMDTIKRAIEIRKSIIKAAGALKPDYPFTKVIPKGWNLEEYIYFRDNLTIGRRKANLQGDSTTYGIKEAQLLRVWLKASRIWAGKKGRMSDVVGDVKDSSGQYRRNASVYTDRVEIGCQTIRRYELEAIAVAKKWAFPG